jgi:glycosyltransferase involved in cell wall biosynthesis
VKSALKVALRSLYHGLVNTFYFTSPARGFSGKDAFLSNSHWTLEQHVKLVPQVKHAVVYPPAPVRVDQSWVPQPTGAPRRFASLGRVAEEKRIEEQIEILDRLRAQGEDVALTIIGFAGDDPCGQRIRALAAARRNWITLAGTKYGADKTALLRTMEFGIHARRDEAFGIAVAEMASHGCLTWVAESSGSTEIVPDPRLHFASVGDAVEKIMKVLQMPREQTDALRRSTRSHVIDNFLPQVFVESFLREVDAFERALAMNPAPVNSGNVWKGASAPHEPALD